MGHKHLALFFHLAGGCVQATLLATRSSVPSVTVRAPLKRMITSGLPFDLH